MRKGLLLLLLFLPLAASADFDIEQLNGISSSPESLSGKFTQQKYLAELDVELSSSGKFEYLRDKFINWETLEPIENLLLMTPESIISQQGGTEVLNMQASSNPVVAMLSELFFAVLTAQWQQLSDYFTISGTVEGGNWQLELIPKDKTLLQVMSCIKLSGDHLLRQVKFYEKGGDYTDISFVELSQ